MIDTRRMALVLFLVAFLVYLFPVIFDLSYKPFFGYIAGQDVVSTSFLPLSLLQRGDFALPEFMDFFKANWRSPFFVANVNGQVVSRYPVAPAVLALPVYGLPLGLGWITDPPIGWLFYPWSVFFVAKFTAALMTALAVVMFFFCARELTDLRTSAITAVAFAFGTSVWSTASQGLWQQTPSILFQTIGVWFLLRGRRMGPRSVAPGALFFSAATVVRANVGFTALLFTVYVLIEHRSSIVRWMLYAVPPALLSIWYNVVYNGSPLVFGYQDGILSYASAPQLNAILGLLVSPSRGLLVYSPFLLLSLCGIWLSRSKQEWRIYSFAGLAFVSIFLSVSSWSWWEGGWGYGTRMLTDGLPYISLLLLPVVVELHGAGLFAFLVAIAWSAILQAMGLWDYGARWHWHFASWQSDVWNLPENQVLFYMKEYWRMAQRFASSIIFREAR